MKKIVFFMLFCFGLFLNFNALGYYEQNDNKCIEYDMSNDTFNDLQKNFISLYQSENIVAIIIPTKTIKFDYSSKFDGIYDVYFDLISGERILIHGNEDIKANLSYMVAFNNIFGINYSVLYYNLNNIKIVDSDALTFPMVDLRSITLGIPFRNELNNEPNFDLDYPYTNIQFD